MRWAILAAEIGGVLGFCFASEAARSAGWAFACPSIPIALLIDHYKSLDDQRLWILIMSLNAARVARLVNCDGTLD
jgi:hypothetical protein